MDIDWNDKLINKEYDRWYWWLQELEKIKDHSTPRYYQIYNSKVVSIQLHIFFDTSEKAYAAVSYWRVILSNDNIHTAIIISKSKVVPYKPLTIPRLELQAAVIAVRLVKTILADHEYKVESIYYWSDSKTALHWIRSDPRNYKIFVMNRLGEIREKSNFCDWRWVPTQENPADDATRWAPQALKKNSRWIKGPSFLRENENYWPVEKDFVRDKSASDEIEKEERTICLITTKFQKSAYLPDYTRFSSWFRLIRATARVFEAIDRWLLKFGQYTDLERQDYAEKIWFREIQLYAFPLEYKYLKNAKTVLNQSRLAPLPPFIDSQGLLRVKSRVKYKPDTRERFQTIILDAKHPVVQLLIKRYHEQNFHKGHETVLNELQQQFWIFGLRKQLRTIINRCGICRMLRALPCNPKMADLPSCRLGYFNYPFTFCGLDFFGPFFVKIGRRREKRWGALFTCMTIRAILLELVSHLTTSSTVMAVQQFAARRGFPNKIISDNGTNFKK